MVTLAKRNMYVSETESSSDEDSDYSPSNKRIRNNSVRKSQINKDVPATSLTFQQNDIGHNTNYFKMKPLSRNAILARENRIKKKAYLQRLENNMNLLEKDKRKLKSIIDNQSFLISELRQEIKYMKSVIANSGDLSKLMRTIHNNTGMSVTTSLDKTLMLNNDCVSKRNAHPWKDQLIDNIPSSKESLSIMVSHSELQKLTFDDLGLPLECDAPFPELFDFDENSSVIKKEVHIPDNTSQDHNYTFIKNDNESCDEDVGICLHVSKHRVSLEFCSTCSENANQTWNNTE